MRISFLLGLALFLFSSAVTQASFYVPAGLNPGDTYQLVFVSDGKISATSGNIATYNSFAQSEATASSITGTGDGVTYNAIASTASVDARDNALVVGPVYNFSGELIASGFDDLWDGALVNEINRDQYGNSLGGKIVWTGTDTQGYGVDSFELGSGSTTVNSSTTGPVSGNSGRDGGKWIDQKREYDDTSEYRIYALSSEITVPGSEVVPEPSTVFVWSLLAFAGGVAMLWQKRRTRD